MEVCKAEIKTETELVFGEAGEIAATVRGLIPCGRVALIAESEREFPAAQTVRSALRGFESYCAVLGGGENASSLFALPDDVRAVVAFGNSAFAFARYFCTLRGAYCVLVPTRADLRGAFEPLVPLKIGGRISSYPAALPHAIFCVYNLLAGCAAAYGDLCLCALSALDCEIDGVFGKGREGGGQRYALFDGVLHLGAVQGKSFFRGLVELSARKATLYARANICTETEAFAKLLKNQMKTDECALFAMRYLTERYRRFFRWGVPREYFVPEYPRRVRFAAAFSGESERDLFLKNKVPTVRAVDHMRETFSQTRAAFYRKAEAIAVHMPRIQSALFALGAKAHRVEAPLANKLFSVCAELADTRSVPSLMRDFGLLI